MAFFDRLIQTAEIEAPPVTPRLSSWFEPYDDVIEAGHGHTMDGPANTLAEPGGLQSELAKVSGVPTPPRRTRVDDPDRESPTAPEINEAENLPMERVPEPRSAGVRVNGDHALPDTTPEFTIARPPQISPPTSIDSTDAPTKRRTRRLDKSSDAAAESTRAGRRPGPTDPNSAAADAASPDPVPVRPAAQPPIVVIRTRRAEPSVNTARPYASATGSTRAKSADRSASAPLAAAEVVPVLAATPSPLSAEPSTAVALPASPPVPQPSQAPVEVTIDRVEVRVASPAPSRPPPRKRKTKRGSAPTLEEYLAAPRKGAR
jgi:hypothetical protein